MSYSHVGDPYVGRRGEYRSGGTWQPLSLHYDAPDTNYSQADDKRWVYIPFPRPIKYPSLKQIQESLCVAPSPPSKP